MFVHFSHTGRGAEAKDALQRALEHDQRLTSDFPKDPEHWYGLAVGHRLMGHSLMSAIQSKDAVARLQMAREVCEKLVADRPDQPLYRSLLVGIQVDIAFELARLDRHREAEPVAHRAAAEAQKLVGQFPDVPGYRLLLANTTTRLATCLAHNGRPREASEAFQASFAQQKKLLAEYPDGDGYRSSLAQLCYNMAEHYATYPDPEHRDPARALEAARKAVELEPKSSACWKILGLAEYRAGNWDAAIKAVEKGLELRGNPGYAYDWTILTLAYAGRGEMEKAREWFRKLPPKPESGRFGDMPLSLYEEAAALLSEERPSSDAKEESPGGGA